jgi:hypothetical protein
MRIIYLILLSLSLSAKAQTVYFSLDTECPMTQKYVLVLNQFKKEFPKIDFQGVFTKWESDSTVTAFRQDYNFHLASLIDKNNAFLQKMQVSVVPEVLFFDEYKHLLYRGSIDNWFYDLGKYRQKATEYYLRDAILAYLAGECIKIEKTIALGCIIEYDDE